jgi:ribosomal protein L40E
MNAMTYRKMLLPSLLLMLLLPTFLVLPVYAVVKLEYLGPYPLTPQLIAIGTLEANAIVGNAGDETANITFRLTADSVFTSHFSYSFLVNNTQVSNFALNGGRRQIFYVNFVFGQATPVQNYNATVSITAVPAAAQSGMAAVESFNIPVSITGSSMTGTPIQASVTTSSQTSSPAQTSPTITSTSTTPPEAGALTQTNMIAIVALIAAIILGAMYLNLRRKRLPQVEKSVKQPPPEAPETVQERESENQIGSDAQVNEPAEEKSEKRYCIRCGADLTVGAKFCDKCGLPLTAG